MKKNLSLFVVILVLLVLVSIGVISAQENSPFGAGAGDVAVFETSEVPVRSPVLSKAEQAAAVAYWTPERDAAARPIVMVDFNADGSINRASLRDEKEVSRQAEVVHPGQANPEAESLAKEAYAEAWAVMAEDGASIEGAAAEGPTAVDGASQVFTGYAILNKGLSKAYPHKYLGRFKFTKASGGTSYCSGTALRKNHVVTAAHCVWDNSVDDWNSNMTFSPAYRNGVSPYGVFPAHTCWIWNSFQSLPSSYSINTWAPIDLAVCNTGLNSISKTLNYMVGNAGWEVDKPYTRHVHNMGYPWNNTKWPIGSFWTAGKYQYACVAESAKYTTEVRRAGCNAGGGMSGGSWLTKYKVFAVSGYVTGVNSGLIYNQNNLYAGRFNASNWTALCVPAYADC